MANIKQFQLLYDYYIKQADAIVPIDVEEIRHKMRLLNEAERLLHIIHELKENDGK